MGTHEAPQVASPHQETGLGWGEASSGFWFLPVIARRATMNSGESWMRKLTSCGPKSLSDRFSNMYSLIAGMSKGKVVLRAFSGFCLLFLPAFHILGIKYPSDC